MALKSDASVQLQKNKLISQAPKTPTNQFKSWALKKFIFVFLILLTGCQNPYKTNYAKAPLYYSRGNVSKVEKPFIIRSDNVSFDAELYKDPSYQREQYDLIGTSNFTYENIKNPEEKIEKVAKDVGAQLVLWNQTPSDSSYNYETAFLVKLEGTKLGYFHSEVSGKREVSRGINSSVYNNIITVIGLSALIVLNTLIKALPFLIL